MTRNSRQKNRDPAASSAQAASHRQGSVLPFALAAAGFRNFRRSHLTLGWSLLGLLLFWLFFWSPTPALAQASGSPAWRWMQPSSSGATLRDVAMRDPQVGFAVGDGPTLLRTLNGGTTWQLRPLPVAEGQLVTVAVRGEVVVAAGPSLLLLSTNTGESFTKVPLSNLDPASLDFVALSLVGDQAGFVLASDGSVWRSLDRFESLRLRSTLSLPSPRAAYFDSNQRGWVLGGAEQLGWLAQTTDGGQTFSEVETGTTGILRALDGVANSGNPVLAVGGAQAAIGITSHEAGQERWLPFELRNSPTSIALNWLADEAEVWATGLDGGLQAYRIPHDLSASTVQSLAVRPSRRPALLALSSSQAGQAIGVGEGGTIIRGKLEKAPSSSTLSGGRSARFELASFPSSNGLFGVLVDQSADYSRLWSTSDGGRSLQGPSDLPGKALALEFFSPQQGLALLENGNLLLFEMGAENYRQGPHLEFSPRAMKFVSSEQGFAGGQGLYRTQDGGQSWEELLAPGQSGAIERLDVFGDHLVASSTHGLILLDLNEDPSDFNLRPTEGNLVDLALSQGGRLAYLLDKPEPTAILQEPDSSPLSIPLPKKPLALVSIDGRFFVLLEEGEVAELSNTGLVNRFSSGANLLGLAQRSSPSGPAPVAFGDFGTLLSFESRVPGTVTPTANAGPDQKVRAQNPVELDGSASTLGAILSWRQVSGPKVQLDDPSRTRPTFTAPNLETQLEFELEARIGGALSVDTVRISVELPPAGNQAPTVVTKGHLLGRPGKRIALDASDSQVFDPSSGKLKASWRQLQGPAAHIEHPNSALTTVLLPELVGSNSLLKFEVEVCDEWLYCSNAEVRVELDDEAEFPQAVASFKQPATRLIGELSQFELEVSWHCPDAPCAGLPRIRQSTGPALHRITSTGTRWLTPRVTHDTPFGLVLSLCDAENRCSAWQLHGTILDTQNEEPVANAGPSQKSYPGQRVWLDGSQSSDPNSETLSFEWTLRSGSPIQLHGARTATPFFDIPWTNEIDRPFAGGWQFELRVCDERQACSTARTQVSVESIPPGNRTPVAVAGPDQVGFVGQVLTLDASSSFDFDGDPLSFRWELPESEELEESPSSGSALARQLHPPTATQASEVFQFVVNNPESFANLEATPKAELKNSSSRYAQIHLQTPSLAPLPVILEVCDLHGACDSDTIFITIAPLPADPPPFDDTLDLVLAGGCACQQSPSTAGILALLLLTLSLRRTQLKRRSAGIGG